MQLVIVQNSYIFPFHYQIVDKTWASTSADVYNK